LLTMFFADEMQLPRRTDGAECRAVRVGRVPECPKGLGVSASRNTPKRGIRVGQKKTGALACKRPGGVPLGRREWKKLLFPYWADASNYRAENDGVERRVFLLLRRGDCP